MTKAKKQTRLTKEELFRPIPATCNKCGGKMIIYADPSPKGTGICLDGCTPAWFVDFVKWREERRSASASTSRSVRGREAARPALRRLSPPRTSWLLDPPGRSASNVRSARRSAS